MRVSFRPTLQPRYVHELDELWAMTSFILTQLAAKNYARHNDVSELTDSTHHSYSWNSTVAQLVNKFPACYGTWIFITVFLTACQRTPSSDSWEKNNNQNKALCPQTATPNPR
jgi:hypothetical protein